MNALRGDALTHTFLWWPGCWLGHAWDYWFVQGGYGHPPRFLSGLV